VLFEYHGSRFCMLPVGFPIGGRDSRNESIDIGHDASPPVYFTFEQKPPTFKWWRVRPRQCAV
jgi:hypothetical protein